MRQRLVAPNLHIDAQSVEVGLQGSRGKERQVPDSICIPIDEGC
jgi:hypothetical protein